MKKRALFYGMLFLLCMFFGQDVCAAQSAEKEEQLEELEEELYKEFDFSEINQFLKKQEQFKKEITFEDFIQILLGRKKTEYQTIGAYIKDIVTAGFAENRTLFLELLTISLGFSVLKNFTKSFSNSYISEICFFVCYCFMTLLLLQSFSGIYRQTLDTTEQMTTFVKLWIPVYCAASAAVLNFNASAAAYSMIFIVIYLTEWLLCNLLVPSVRIYIMVEFLNHFMEEEHFKRLSELIFNGIQVLLKGAVTFILGINLIQGMVAPAMDRLAGNTVARTIQMIPAVGNVMSGTGQILISSGIVIKNSIGAAALLVLILLCAVPFLKTAGVAVLYKILAAVLEPAADKRFSGGINALANGGLLCVKIMTTCLTLFFLTIALSSASAGFAQ